MKQKSIWVEMAKATAEGVVQGAAEGTIKGMGDLAIKAMDEEMKRSADEKDKIIDAYVEKNLAIMMVESANEIAKMTEGQIRAFREITRTQIKSTVLIEIQKRVLEKNERRRVEIEKQRQENREKRELWLKAKWEAIKNPPKKVNMI